MTLRLYNTLTRKKSPFEPLVPGQVRMYVCGPTVYDSCHIGHARSVVVFDVLYRYLQAKGFDVTYIRNFTDVDDKIINRANETGQTSEQVAETFINEFSVDMGSLGVVPASAEPRATAHIGDIIDVIERLIKRGHAYPVDGDVYFRVASFEGYGKLSGRKLEDMEAGARIEVDDRKENPFDFALWKAAKPGEPFWESPWGQGRPGWHIECSAMSHALLGKTFDIHGGGKDLIFPHHENEIAQSEAAFGVPFARYWVHNGFVNIDQEKMSKSLGNFLMIKDVIKEFHPETIRMFLLSSHYRSPIDFTDQIMEEADTGLERIYSAIHRMNEAGVEAATGVSDGGPLWQQFVVAMDDDVNTAKAIGHLFDGARQVNKLMDENSGDAGDKETLSLYKADFEKVGAVIGLFQESPEAFLDRKKTAAISGSDVNPDEIDQLIQERADARKNKDFARADEIRDILAAKNIVLEDGPGGTTWNMG